MMFQMNDNLLDPCPQCALKHLRAASAEYVFTKKLAWRRDASLKDRLASYKREDKVSCVDPGQFELALESYGAGVTWISVALVNLVEVQQGYKTHLDYALGCMTRAEENFAGGFAPELSKKIRDLRLEVTTSGDPGPAIRFLHEKYRDRGMGALSVVADHYTGHIVEAFREFPDVYEKLMGSETYDFTRLSPANAWFDATMLFGDDVFTDPRVLPVPEREAAWAVSAIVRLAIDATMVSDDETGEVRDTINWLVDTYFKQDKPVEAKDRPEDLDTVWMPDLSSVGAWARRNEKGDLEFAPGKTSGCVGTDPLGRSLLDDAKAKLAGPGKAKEAK